MSRSLVNDMQNNSVELKADFQKARELGPKNAAVYLVMGALGDKVNQTPNQVLADYEMALKLNERLSQAYLLKGYFYRLQHDFKRSCENTSKAEELGAIISQNTKDYLCKDGVADKNESELNSVIYPYLRETVMSLK